MELNKTYYYSDLKDLIKWVEKNSVVVNVYGQRKKEEHVFISFTKNGEQKIRVNSQQLKKILEKLKKHKVDSVIFSLNTYEGEGFDGSWMMPKTVQCSITGLGISYETPTGTKGMITLPQERNVPYLGKIDVKGIPIIQYSEYYTKKNYISSDGTATEVLGVVYYDGQTLTATNSQMAIQVRKQLPGVEPGIGLTKDGLKLKVQDYPIKRLNELFEEQEVKICPAILTLEGENLKQWIQATKTLDDLLSKFRLSKNKYEAEKIVTLKVSENEIVLTPYKLYDKQADTSHSGNYTLDGKVEWTDETSSPIERHFNVGYLYRALQVLTESDAERIEIHLGDVLLFVRSNIGRAIIMGIRMNN